MFRRPTLMLLTAATAFGVTGCGGRLFRRPCSDSTPPRADRDSTSPSSSRGVIQPREVENISPSTLPTTPGISGPRPFDPAGDYGRRDTFSPVRPGPRLGDPPSPYQPYLHVPTAPTDLPSSPDDLPYPAESRKVTPDTDRPKKLILVPDDATPPTKSESKSPTRTEGGLPVPDRNVLLDPVAPGGSLALPAEDGTQHTANYGRDQERDKSTVGLPDFTTVKGYENVATGKKPNMDGLDRLKRNGYRTVIFLHDPAADVAPAKSLCEARGLKFVGIPMAADQLKVASEAFAVALAEKANRPVYVSDDSGDWTGTLWYIHFRATEQMNADAAKVRAASLGLGDQTRTEKSQKVWQTVQDFLATR